MRRRFQLSKARRRKAKLVLDDGRPMRLVAYVKELPSARCVLAVSIATKDHAGGWLAAFDLDGRGVHGTLLLED